MRIRTRPLVLTLLLAVAVVVPGSASAQLPTDPVVGTLNDLLDQIAVEAGLCSDLDPFECLLPLPNDRFTAADDDTPTGLRIDFDELAMLRNVEGKPIDPTEWNRNDGWSPGSMLLTYVPGLDLDATFGIDFPQVERPSLSLAPDAPIVIVDTTDGSRHPYMAELDHHAGTDPSQALLIVRPLRNFEHGHRYVVGLRDLVATDGATIAAQDVFAAQRDAYTDPAGDDVIGPLEDAGVDPASLYLAWDFTIASAENIAGRALAIRDNAFATLGDDDLSDRVVSGDAPAFTIDSVQEIDDADSDTARLIEGRVTVPYYLDRPDALGTPAAGPAPAQAAPGHRLNYTSPNPGPMDTPVRNSLTPTIQAAFTCSMPRTATADAPAKPLIYGHGLLGSRGESRGGSGARMRERNRVVCGVDWYGFYNRDIANVAVALNDMSNFASIMDKVQQGYLHFLFTARALVHPDGLVTTTAFQDSEGNALLDIDGLAYDGNSQGGIMGGGLTALAPDWEEAVLGVPGMNYSTLLHRSVDFEGDLLAPGVGYATAMYASYPEKEDQLILMHLIQMLWDRGETNGFAHHATDDPLPNTPPHRILLHPAIGDYQVANLSAEVAARTMGAALLQTTMPEGRHWADHTGERAFAFETFAENPDGSVGPHDGSALVYWDSGNHVPPSVNVPPAYEGQDPHEDPRRDPFAAAQKIAFYETGTVIDPHAGRSWYCTHTFPRIEEEAYDCSRADAAPAPVEPAPAPQPLPATGGGLALLGLVSLGAAAAAGSRLRR